VFSSEGFFAPVSPSKNPERPDFAELTFCMAAFLRAIASTAVVEYAIGT